MKVVRIMSPNNPRGIQAVGDQVALPDEQAERWVGRGWGSILGDFQEEILTEAPAPEYNLYETPVPEELPVPKRGKTRKQDDDEESINV